MLGRNTGHGMPIYDAQLFVECAFYRFRSRSVRLWEAYVRNMVLPGERWLTPARSPAL
jgi:hypothetical protein